MNKIISNMLIMTITSLLILSCTTYQYRETKLDKQEFLGDWVKIEIDTEKSAVENYLKTREWLAEVTVQSHYGIEYVNEEHGQINTNIEIVVEKDLFRELRMRVHLNFHIKDKIIVEAIVVDDFKSFSYFSGTLTHVHLSDKTEYREDGNITTTVKEQVKNMEKQIKELLKNYKENIEKS